MNQLAGSNGGASRSKFSQAKTAPKYIRERETQPPASAFSFPFFGIVNLPPKAADFQALKRSHVNK